MNVITRTAPRAAMSHRETTSRRRHSSRSIRGITRSAWIHMARFIGPIVADVSRYASRRLREADVEGRGVSGAALRRLEQQLVPAAGIDAVLRVTQEAARLLVVGHLREQLGVETVVEEELRSEVRDLRAARCADLEVDVHGAAAIPAGVDRR